MLSVDSFLEIAAENDFQKNIAPGIMNATARGLRAMMIEVRDAKSENISSLIKVLHNKGFKAEGIAGQFGISYIKVNW